MKIYKSACVELERFVILDSVTMKVGQPVKLANSGVDVADAVSDLLYGLCVGIVDKNGIPLEQVDAGDYGGTYTASTQTYVADASNIASERVSALVQPFKGHETLTALADAAIGTTTGSDKPGYFIDVLTSDCSKLDESNTHASNVLQFITVDNGMGVNSCQDPVLGGNNILVKPREIQVPGAQG